MHSKKRYHSLHVTTADRYGWFESAETLAALVLVWTVMENARHFFCAHPRDRTAWKTLRSACANLQEVIAEGLHACFEEYTSPNPNDHQRITTRGEGKEKGGQAVIVAWVPVSPRKTIREPSRPLCRLLPTLVNCGCQASALPLSRLPPPLNNSTRNKPTKQKGC